MGVEKVAGEISVTLRRGAVGRSGDSIWRKGAPDCLNRSWDGADSGDRAERTLASVRELVSLPGLF